MNREERIEGGDEGQPRGYHSGAREKGSGDRKREYRRALLVFQYVGRSRPTLGGYGDWVES